MNLRVRVPASTSNIGPGFDCFGMAVSMHLEVEVRPSDRLRVTAEGAEVPLDASNLVVRTFLEAMDPPQREPAYAFHLRNRIPLARGLGSSASALVAGLALAQAVRSGGAQIDRARVAAEAARLEGHPDNAYAATWGGFCISASDGEFERIELNDARYFALIPDVQIHTEEARRALPRTISLEDAVFNLQRSALAAARVMRTRALSAAGPFVDRLHQRHRLALEPRLKTAFELLEQHEAVDALFLSGSGPTVFCLPKYRDAARRAAEDAFARSGLGLRIEEISADNDGVTVSETPSPSGKGQG